MGIKLGHTHEDGKKCYVTRSRQKLTDKGLVRFIDPITFKATEYGVAYMPYTGHWYLFDLKTGREVADGPARSGWYEVIVKPNRIADLIDDPDCRPL